MLEEACLGWSARGWSTQRLGSISLLGMLLHTLISKSFRDGPHCFCFLLSSCFFFSPGSSLCLLLHRPPPQALSVPLWLPTVSACFALARQGWNASQPPCRSRGSAWAGLCYVVHHCTEQEWVIRNSGCMYIAHLEKPGHDSEKPPGWARTQVWLYWITPQSIKRWKVGTRQWLCGRCVGHRTTKAETQPLTAVLWPPVHPTADSSSKHHNGKTDINKQG